MGTAQSCAESLPPSNWKVCHRPAAVHEMNAHARGLGEIESIFQFHGSVHHNNKRKRLQAQRPLHPLIRGHSGRQRAEEKGMPAEASGLQKSPNWMPPKQLIFILWDCRRMKRHLNLMLSAVLFRCAVRRIGERGRTVFFVCCGRNSVFSGRLGARFGTTLPESTPHTTEFRVIETYYCLEAFADAWQLLLAWLQIHEQPGNSFRRLFPHATSWMLSSSHRAIPPARLCVRNFVRRMFLPEMAAQQSYMCHSRHMHEW